MNFNHAKTPWIKTFRIYTQPETVTMIFLGFAAGLPYLLVFSTLSAWLREMNISLTAIGFFSWIGITYSIKVLWAPIIDHLPIPWLTFLLGKRRSWILIGQLGIVCGLLGMALTDPVLHTKTIFLFGLLVAFSSATQDISIDAYRIEIAQQRFQAAMAAMYILGYRVGLLIAGAGALYIAEYSSWTIAYMAMAGLMIIGIITTLVIREPDRQITHQNYLQEQSVIRFLKHTAHWPPLLQKSGAWITGAVVCPFVDFFIRNRWLALIILLLIGVYRFSDIAMGIMANPFYLDLGYSKTQIAQISKLFGFFMTILGAGLGGIFVMRNGIMRPLLLGAIMAAITNLLFAYLAYQNTPDTLLLTLVICADNLSGGFANAVLIAYLSSLTNIHYTATQYALFNSLMTLPGKFVSGYSGMIAEVYGFVSFFTYTAIAGLPAILLVIYLTHTQKNITDKNHSA